MSGKKSRLKELALRKQLLLAESEINRVQLVNEWKVFTDEAHVVTTRARSICSSVSSTVSMGIAGVKAIRDMRSSNGKSSWISKLFSGVKLGSALWRSVRDPR